jgi:AcrR family transcriptional regulator
VNLAAVNYHFGDKAQLYVAALRQACLYRAEEMQTWPPGTRPEVKLREYIGQVLTRMLDPRRPTWHVPLILRETVEPSGATAEMIEADLRPRIDVLHGIVAELLPEGAPVSQQHLMTFSIIGQCIFYHMNRWLIRQLVGDEEFQSYTIERLADHIARLTLAAVGRPQPAGDSRGGAPRLGSETWPCLSETR